MLQFIFSSSTEVEACMHMLSSNILNY